MLSPKEVVGRVSSRLNRLSASLPRLNTSSKLQKDPPPPPPPDRPAPQAYETSTPENLLPPSRAPPPTPQHTKTPSNGSSSSRQLHNTQTPPDRLPVGTPTSLTGNLNSLPPNRPRGNSLLPPAPSSETTIVGGYRAVSSPMASRPTSYHSEGEMAPTTKRKSWMPSVPGMIKPRSRNVSQNLELTHDLGAWVNAGEHKIIYNSNLLIQGERVRTSRTLKTLLIP
jgi:hypothetical protein